MAGAVEVATDLAETEVALHAEGLPCTEVSVGSTPTVYSAEASVGATESVPGTYVFHDANSLWVGLVTEAECALTMLATVVGRPAPERRFRVGRLGTLSAIPTGRSPG